MDMLLHALLLIHQTSSLKFENLSSQVDINDKFCAMGQHREGQWNFHEDILKKSFVCCGFDANDFQDREIQEFCHRTVHKKSNYFGSDNIAYLDIMHVGGHGCICDEFGKTRLNTAMREKWTWNPTECKLREWNATLFCSILGDRQVLLMGDSTAQQTAATLMAMLQSASPRGMCSSRIQYINDFRLVDVRPLERYDADIIIIGAGAHYHNSTYYKEKMTAAIRTMLGLNETTKSMETKDKKSRKKLLWKSINPGHLNCDLYKNATTTPNSYKTSADRFHWGLAPEMDLIMKEVASQYDIPFIDMYPLYLRPDSHPGKNSWSDTRSGGDCLHLCVPGPLDIFSVLLMHYLLDEEVERQNF